MGFVVESVNALSFADTANADNEPAELRVGCATGSCSRAGATGTGRTGSGIRSCQACRLPGTRTECRNRSAHIGSATDLYVTWMQELPLAVFDHRISIFLAQEADVVGVLQLLDGVRIASVLAVETFDSACVLRAAVDHLHLAITLSLLSNARSNGENTEHHEGHEKDQHHEHVAGLRKAVSDP